MIGANLEWLVREMDRLVTTKKLDLHKLRPGSVVATEPKIIWITMIARPAPSRVLALKKKFNAILEETLFESRGMYILNANQNLNATHFDRSNQLMANGKTTYWQNIDQAIQLFDNHKGPSLKPEPVISAAPAKKEPKFGLRKPPPKK